MTGVTLLEIEGRESFVFRQHSSYFVLAWLSTLTQREVRGCIRMK